MNRAFFIGSSSLDHRRGLKRPEGTRSYADKVLPALSTNSSVGTTPTHDAPVRDARFITRNMGETKSELDPLRIVASHRHRRGAG
jgi:hypothetical protein